MATGRTVWTVWPGCKVQIVPVNQARTIGAARAVARGAGPLQRQVEDQLRAAIRSGALVAGERLPSSRVLAADLGVSRGVVSDAYGQLAAEGWLVVAPRVGPAWSLRRRGAASLLRRRPSLLAAPVRYDLRPGRPDFVALPAGGLAAVAQRGGARRRGDAELDYPPLAGSLRLRRCSRPTAGGCAGRSRGPRT